MLNHRTIAAAWLLIASGALAQTATVYEIGGPGPTDSVSVSGLSDAREAAGSVGGQMFIYRDGGTFIISPPANAASLSPSGMSPSALIVGSFARTDDPFTPRAFRIDGRSLAFTELGPPTVGDPTGVRGLAISDDGTQILGEAPNFFDGTIGHTRRPVAWTDAGGAAEDIGDNALVFTLISDINNAGRAVGTARIHAGPVVWSGYARIDGDWLDIGGFGGGRTDARAINNLGIVTGNSRFSPTQSFGFRWSADTFEMEMLFPPFGMSNAVGRDINDLGTVVGSANQSGNSTAVYWPAGSPFGINLNSHLPPGSGWTRLSSIESIDRCGVVVGQGIREDRPGYFSGFMMVLPEFDLDGDGLPDCWESVGIDANNDGTIDLDLPAMGADPARKDLFVEIDAMTGRAPAANVLSRVTTAFANAPVANPDGSTGITLHAMVDETNLPLTEYPNSFDDFDDDKDDHFGTLGERADSNSANILAARRLVFRYCIFANTYDNSSSSGLAELGGNDFMVTLGGWTPPGGTPDEQAGTFMHEFGHTIGLMHGGGDSVNYKPNYYSVMSYAWQVPKSAYMSSWRLDYSRIELPDLHEFFLFEDLGLGGSPGSLPGVSIPFRASDNTFQLAVSTGPEPIDWDHNGSIDVLPVGSDLNHLYQSDPSSPGEVLTGHDDWANLAYNFRLSPSFADGVHETVAELTYEEHLAVESQFAGTNPCPGDIADDFGTLGADGMVSFGDFLALLGLIGPCPGGTPGCTGDIADDFGTLNGGDGMVSFGDFLALLGLIGPCP